MAAALTPRVKVPGEKTPLHKVVSECFKGWLDDRSAREQPVAGYGEQEFRGYLTCGLLCFRFTRAGCTRCTQTFVVAFSCKARGVCPSCNGRHMARDGRASCRSRHPAGARAAVVISVPKRLRGMLADRPQAVAALTKIFLDEIERLLLAASGVTAAADTLSASRSRLGGISPATVSARRSTTTCTSTPASPTASSCRLLPKQAVTPRLRSCRRGQYTAPGRPSRSNDSP